MIYFGNTLLAWPVGDVDILKTSGMSLKYLSISIACFLFAGCSSIGPHQIKLDRNRYNDVIQVTNNEQLLMNIVRLRYVEPMTTLRLTNVTSSYTLNPNITTTGTGISSVLASNVAPGSAGSSVTRTLNVSPGIQYSDTPTISYVPIENAEFVRDLMEPIALYKIHLFDYGGIADSTLILRLAFQNIGDMENASTASSERVRTLPEYKTYYQFVENSAYLFDTGITDLRVKKIGKNTVLSSYILPQYRHSHRINQMKKMLGLKDKNLDEFIISDVPLNPNLKNVVYVRMRSAYGVMVFLSHGVHIPESDVRKHHVYTNYNADGTPYDWTPLTKGLLNVKSSETEPTNNVYVKVMVHGHWFYIENSDLDSKTTFLLLNRLIALSSTSLDKIMGTGPALTLPAR